MAEDELGLRVGEGSASGPTTCAPEAAAEPGLAEDEQQRLDNLGANGPRDVSGLTMTHCVPNERVATAGEEDMVGA